MTTKRLYNWVNRFRPWRIASIALVLALLPQQIAFAAPFQPKVDFSANEINYWDPRGNNICGTSLSGSNDTITRFLQALAAQESGGNIKAISGTGAKGKYQYVDGTWRDHAARYYPPASKYPTALDAPEEYQDALAYIEYTDKFKTFNGDLFTLAVSHFYPKALTDPSFLDIVPPGNVVTPRQYAQQFIQKMSTGAGKDIPMLASKAPDFQTFLDKVLQGGNSSSSNGSSQGLCSSSGVVAGNILQTALGLAWPTPGHGKNMEDATPPYQKIMPQVQGNIGDDPFSDCGVFVATVMISSKADESYQKRGTSSQLDYIRAHPEKFQLFDTSEYTQQSGKLQPGDILIQDGHTYIFTGPNKGQDGKLYNSVSASLHDHVPEVTNWYPGFYVARAVKK